VLQRLAILTPLRHREFRLLFFGELVSDLGDWLDFLALIALIVYRWNLGAPALAALSVAMVLPHVVVAPIAGVWVDRLPRKRLMIAADLGRALVVLGLVWAPELVSLLALVLVKVALSTLFGPARQSAVREIVPNEDLLAANGLTQLSVQTTKVLGPMVGGVLVSLAGPRAAFVVDAVTFLVSAAFLSQLPALQRPRAAESEGEEQAHEARGGFWRELRSGLIVIFHRRALSVAVVGMTAALFMIFAFDGLGPLALRQLGVGEALLGVAIGSIGFGAATGAVVVTQWARGLHPFVLMGGGKMIAGLLAAVVGAAAIVHSNAGGLAWIPVWLGIGLSSAAIFVPYGYILQRETPPEMMGRVFASANSLQTAFQLAAPVLGAALAETIGIGFVLGAFGLGLSVVGLTVLLLRPAVGGRMAEADVPVETSPA
jgi:MFS family permease